MDRTTKDVDAFLAGLEGRQGEDVRRLDAEFSRLMKDHERHLYEGKFWGGTDQQIVGYRVVDYTNTSGDEVEWFLVGLAAQKNHISVYVNAVVDGAYLLREYENKLGRAKVGSASIAFETIDALDLEALLELVGRAAAA